MGFVSNSSSSSFLIIGDQSFPYDDVELTHEQKELVKEQGYDIPLDKKVRLSCFVSDGLDWDFLYVDGHYSKGKVDSIIEYRDGGHGYPYDNDSYEEIAENIWLYKGDEEDE